MYTKIISKIFLFFSIGFNEKNFDEVSESIKISKKLDTKINYKYITKTDIPYYLLNAISKLDTPISDPSIIPTFCLAKFASEHVKVVLSGDGADELFGGYNRHIFFNVLQKIRKMKFGKGIEIIKYFVQHIPNIFVNPYYQNLFLKVLNINDTSLLSYYMESIRIFDISRRFNK